MMSFLILFAFNSLDKFNLRYSEARSRDTEALLQGMQ